MGAERLKSLACDLIEAVNRGSIEQAMSYTAPGCTLNGEPYGQAYCE